MRIGLQALGVQGLVPTGAPPDILLHALGSLCSSGNWFTPIPPRTPLFTTRDLAMLQLLEAGTVHKQIAEHLHSTLTGVDKRLAKLRRRFGVASTSGLVALMVERGLTHLPPETLTTSRPAERLDDQTT
ncbi:MAG: hypothetical protein SGI84_15330, partial [Gemmatimonadota bacterium]|nr:hypothetical protein [Gemmatimonadota bacterium]